MKNTYENYQEAKEELKQKLYANDLYREGEIHIIFDKENMDFYIAEFPLKSNVYIANNEISIIYVDISQLDETFLSNEYKDQPGVWESIIDLYIENTEQEQIYDQEKTDIIENVGVEL